MAAAAKMETIEHFAKIIKVARLLGREHLISREEVERLQGLRGTTASPRLLRDDPNTPQDVDQISVRCSRRPNRRRAAGSGRQRNASASEQRKVKATRRTYGPDIDARTTRLDKDTYG